MGEPPAKRQRTCSDYDENKMALESLIRSHRSCESQISRISSSVQWFECFEKVENGVAALRNMRARLQMQRERAQSEIQSEKRAFVDLERENSLRREAQFELQCQLNSVAQ